MGFKKGNQEWRKRKRVGRPRRTTEEKYLKWMRQCVTKEDLVRIVETAIARAKAGDDRARRFLFGYLVGQPTQYVTADIESESEHVIVIRDETKD